MSKFDRSIRVMMEVVGLLDVEDVWWWCILGLGDVGDEKE